MMNDDGTAESKTVDISADEPLRVNVADALNEQDVVKFTVHTRTSMERFLKRDFSVSRQHDEFVWLYNLLIDNDDYAGYIIPPCPPKPDFSQSHGKLTKLHADNSSMPPDELEKLKQEIQSEYLSAFQKTVAMHEVFLMRLASHPVFRGDSNFQVFLEYDKDLACRAKSKKDRAMSFLSSISKAVDSSFSSHKDTDEFFEQQKFFITHYNTVVKEAMTKSEAKVKRRLAVVSQLDRVGTELTRLANSQSQYAPLAEAARIVGDHCLKAEVIVKKLAAKEDLKLTDLLRYYVADGQAAKDLMYRRVKAYGAQEEARKKHDAAKKTGKKVLESEEQLTQATQRFDNITKSAKEELEVFKQRRLVAFRKGIVQYTQCQIRQARDEYQMWKDLLTTMRSSGTSSSA